MFPPLANSPIARSAWRGWSKLSSLCAVSIRSLLDSPTAMLLAAGLLLPNLLSLATLGSFIDVGLPPRTSSILLYAALAMCARLIPFFLTADPLSRDSRVRHGLDAVGELRDAAA